MKTKLEYCPWIPLIIYISRYSEQVDKAYKQAVVAIPTFCAQSLQDTVEQLVEAQSIAEAEGTTVVIACTGY